MPNTTALSPDFLTAPLPLAALSALHCLERALAAPNVATAVEYVRRPTPEAVR